MCSDWLITISYFSFLPNAASWLAPSYFLLFLLDKCCFLIDCFLFLTLPSCQMLLSDWLLTFFNSSFSANAAFSLAAFYFELLVECCFLIGCFIFLTLPSCRLLLSDWLLPVSNKPRGGIYRGALKSYTPGPLSLRLFYYYFIIF